MIFKKMVPDKLSFLSEFDNFYNKLTLDVKEDRYSKQEFYLTTRAKCKAMDRTRRDNMLLLNKEAN